MKTGVISSVAFAFIVSTAMCDVVDATKPGFRQVSGVSVSQGTTQTVADDVIINPQGEFRKIGEGKLVVPMSRVNRQLPWGMKVSEGTLRLEAGDDATLPVETVPQAFSKAVLWLDASSAVVTNADDTSYVAKWVDVRDVAHPDSPTYAYALPAWGSRSPNVSIPPVKVEKDGRPALYFGGKTSGKHMNLSSTVQNVIHQFVVHGFRICHIKVLPYRVTVRIYERKNDPDISVFEKVLVSCLFDLGKILKLLREDPFLDRNGRKTYRDALGGIRISSRSPARTSVNSTRKWGTRSQTKSERPPKTGEKSPLFSP